MGLPYVPIVAAVIALHAATSLAAPLRSLDQNPPHPEGITSPAKLASPLGHPLIPGRRSQWRLNADSLHNPLLSPSPSSSSLFSLDSFRKHHAGDSGRMPGGDLAGGASDSASSTPYHSAHQSPVQSPVHHAVQEITLASSQSSPQNRLHSPNPSSSSLSSTGSFGGPRSHLWHQASLDGAGRRLLGGDHAPPTPPPAGGLAGGARQAVAKKASLGSKLLTGAKHDIFHNTFSLSLGALAVLVGSASVVHAYNPSISRRDIDELQDPIYERELEFESDKLD